MASLPGSAPRRGGDFICLTCRNYLRPIQRAQFTTVRTLKTTSSARNTLTIRNALNTRRTPLPPRSQPSYSTTTFAAPPTSSGIAPLPHRRLLVVSGPDAAKFLQGLVTNNIDASHQSSLYSAFLDARGRVLWDVFIWVWPELVSEQGHWACYIEVDAAEVEALKKHLKRHKLRSKVTIEDVSEDSEAGVRVWAAWGEAGERWGEDAVVAKMEDPRAPRMRRYLARAGENVEGADVLDTEAYHLQRYRHGIPEGPLEIPRETALPMECNFDLYRGIDFKKGCYVGQELTIRTKHTGVVRKRILPVSIQPSTALPANGADIKALDENGEIKKGRPTGKFIAGVGNVGLALCRLENMTSMKISAEGGSWKPGMEFGVEGEGGVMRVKPVLFEWFVLRERELWDKGRTRI